MDKHNKQAIYITARDRFEKAIETMLEMGKELDYTNEMILEDITESTNRILKLKGRNK